MNDNLRDALAERLWHLEKAWHAENRPEPWHEYVASRLLESVPGEEEMAKIVKMGFLASVTPPKVCGETHVSNGPHYPRQLREAKERISTLEKAIEEARAPSCICAYNETDCPECLSWREKVKG